MQESIRDGNEKLNYGDTLIDVMIIGVDFSIKGLVFVNVPVTSFRLRVERFIKDVENTRGIV